MDASASEPQVKKIRMTLGGILLMDDAEASKMHFTAVFSDRSTNQSLMRRKPSPQDEMNPCRLPTEPIMDDCLSQAMHTHEISFSFLFNVDQTLLPMRSLITYYHMGSGLSALNTNQHYSPQNHNEPRWINVSSGAMNATTLTLHYECF